MATQKRHKKSRQKWKNQRVSNYDLNTSNRDLLGDAKTAPEYIQSSRLYSQSTIDDIVMNNRFQALTNQGKIGKNAKSIAQLRRMVTPNNVPPMNIQSEKHRILRAVTAHKLAGMQDSHLKKELVYGTRIALGQSFKELSSRQIGDLMYTESLTDDPMSALSKIEAMAAKYQKPSLMMNLSRQVGMIGKRDISNMTNKYSFAPETSRLITEGEPLKAASRMRSKLSQAMAASLGTAFTVSDQFKVMEMAGAPVAEFDIRKGAKVQKITLPLGSRVPLNNINHFIYGMYNPITNQAKGGKPLSFSDHIINELVDKNGLLSKWDKGEFHFGLTGEAALKKFRGLYGEQFPSAMPAPAGAGISGVWEKRYAGAVNIQVPSDATPQQIQAIMKEQLGKEGYALGPKAEMISTPAGMKAFQMQYGYDPSKLVPFGSGDEGIMNWSRKPLNFMRNEVYMTEMAAGEAHRYQRARGIKALVTSAGAKEMADRRNLSAAVLYAPKGAMPARLGEGEAIARRSLESMLELEQTRHYHVAAREGVDPVARQIMEAHKTGKPVRLPQGVSLGIGYETMREITSKGKVEYTALGDELDSIFSATMGDSITEEIVSAKRVEDSDMLHVVTRRMIRGHSGVKVFEDLKHTLMTYGPEAFEKEAYEVGINKRRIKMMLDNFNTDVIVESDILHKDARLRRKQMTSGLRHILAQSGIDDPFVKAPMTYLEGIGGKYGTEQELLKVARKHGISSAQFGMVFGTYAEELKSGKDVISDIGFSSREQAWIRRTKGAALGIASMTPGGGELAIDIGRGTFEQRAIWKMMAGGESTAEIARMMAGRRTIETGRARTEVEKAVASLAGDVSMLTEQQKAGARAIDYKLLAEGVPGSIYGTEGMAVKVPEKYRGVFKGSQHLYVPSQLELSSMAPYTDPVSGEKMAGATLKQYESLVGMMHEDRGLDAVRNQARSLNIELSEQYAALAAGKQKLTGTARVQVQKAYTAAGATLGEELTVRTSMDLMEKMWGDMHRAGAEASFIAEQRRAFEAGEEVMGVAWRHPQTAKFSALPVKMVHDPTLGVGGVGYHFKASEAVMKAVRGDYDADTMGIAAVMNRREDESLKKLINSSNFDAEFTAYGKQHDLFKAARREGVKLGALDQFDKMGQKAKQMLATEIGGVDYAYEQILKGAIATGEKGLIDDAMLLYDFVPQELISAKHLTAKEAEELAGVSQELFRAVSTIQEDIPGRRADALKTIISRSISSRFDVAALESQGVMSQKIEDVLSKSIAGLGEKDIAEDFMQLAKKGAYDAETIALAENPEQMIARMRQARESIYAPLLPDSIAADTMLKRPRTDSATESLISNVKTKMKSLRGGPGTSAGLIAGAAAVAGSLFYLAARSREDAALGGYDTMAPPPMPAAGPSATPLLVPEMNFQAKPRFVTPDQIQGRVGMPPTPDPIQQTPRGMISQDMSPMSNVIKIRGRDSANSDYNDITRKIVESMKIPSSINVNVNDNSKQITSEMVDRLLEGAY